MPINQTEIEKYFKKNPKIPHCFRTNRTFTITKIDNNSLEVKSGDRVPEFRTFDYAFLSLVIDNFQVCNDVTEIREFVNRVAPNNKGSKRIHYAIAREYLDRSGAKTPTPIQHIQRTLEDVQLEFEKDIEEAKKRSSEERKARLEKAPKKPPEPSTVTTKVFKRNADVVEEVLERADGVCEACGNDAPFKRAKDDTPYLEVHHIIRLADGGYDTVENAIALCPNCHRELHFGKSN